MGGGFWNRVFGLDPKAAPRRVRVSVAYERSDLPTTPAPRTADGPRDVVGAGYMAVHGEHFKRATIDRLMRPSKTGNAIFPEATLRPNPHPKHANAVMVLVRGDHVGYLPRHVADEFIDSFGGAELRCSAEIRRTDPTRDWNVVLRVDYDKLRKRAANTRAQAKAAACAPKLDAVSAAAARYDSALADRLASPQLAELKRARDRAIVEARVASEHRPTLALVAEAAGVSVNTVSRITKAAETG